MNPWKGMAIDRREAVCPQLVGRIKRLLAAGVLHDGEPLPSRREAAAELEINPNTVQKAYRQLEEENLLVTDGNQGSMIHCPPEIFSGIRQELMRDMAVEFVKSAQEMQLTFKQTLDLLSETWEEIS